MRELDIPCCGGRVEEQPLENLGVNTECACGGVKFPELSRVENPENPKIIASPDFIKDLEKLALSMGIESIGYTKLAPEIKPKIEPLYPHAIVLNIKTGRDILQKAPGREAQKLNDNLYAHLAQMTYILSDFIRKNNYASHVAHPYGDMVNLSLMGQRAGLGWIGKSGLLITPQSGPRSKISAIFTSIENLPLKKCEDHSWILDYCEKCGKCIKACPQNALTETKSENGTRKVKFNQKLCIGCSHGCNYCIEECPFTRKGYPALEEKMNKIKSKEWEK